jgi:VWFA-related protein
MGTKRVSEGGLRMQEVARRSFLLALSGLLSLQACVSVAQQQESEDDILRSRSNLVLVPTLVKDAAGSIVYGLRADDFTIWDNGMAQTVHLDEAPEAEPVSLVIAVQVGGRASREFSRIHGLAAMLDPILTAPNTEAALLLFDTNLNLAHDFTRNADVIEEELKHQDRGDNGAAILDAVAMSAKMLNRRRPERRRVLLLISETRDHGSHFANLDQVVRMIGLTNTAVYALSFSPYASQQLDVLRGANRDEWQSNVDFIEKLVAIRNAMKKNTPEALAEMTGGEYELFMTRKSFEADLGSFANHLHSRYLLSFEPKNPQPGVHEIRVSLKDPNEKPTLLFRRSYWAADLKH